MRILTEDQYQRRIEAAKQEGREEAERRIYERREFCDFQDAVWREHQNLAERINQLESRSGTGCEKPRVGSDDNCVSASMPIGHHVTARC